MRTIICILIYFLAQPNAENQIKNGGAAIKVNQNAQNEKNDEATSVISLVLVLDSLFILNQFGYCLVAISNIIRTNCGECESGMQLGSAMFLVGDIFECLSHSLNFYFYLKFSTLLRQEFFAIVTLVKTKIL